MEENKKIEENTKQNSTEQKKKIDVWKILKVINLILTGIYIIAGIFMVTQIVTMKLLPMRLLALACVALLIIPVLSVLLRNKKVAIIIFIILNIVVSLVEYKGYTMLDKADEVVDKVTEGGDVEVTVMEIRVLADNEATDETVLKEYTVGLVKEIDRKYADEVVKGIEESIGQKLTTKEYDDVGLLVKALYDGEIDAIIINSTYAAMFEETEDFATYGTDTKVLKEVEIEEIIKTRNDAIEESQKGEDSTEETTTEGSSGSSGGSSSSNNDDYYKWYLGEYGDEGGGFVYVEPTDPKEMSKDAFVVYISGIDTYGNVNRKCRSDVNILMAVNTKTKKVLMVNTPRDYYVPLSVSNGVRDKLTHAGNFGVNCSKNTLGMLYGVEAEYYVRMNFTGFIDIINAMGGVDVYSEYAFGSYKKGMNYGLNGFQALAFARERKSLAGGDNQRGKNQMEVIKGMINKLATSDTLFNYNAIMDAIAGSFQTNFTSDEIYSLIHMQLDDMSSWTVESYSVTGKGKSAKTYSMPSVNAYVMEPNMATVYKAREMLNAVLTEQ